MWRKFFIATIVIFCFGGCQRTDKISMEQKDTIEAFNQSYDNSLEDRDPDSALLLAQKVLSFKAQIHDQEIVFRALTNAGLAHERLRQPDSTAIYYIQALRLAYLMNEPSNIAFALQMRGNLQIDQKKYKSAEQSFLEALEINCNENDSCQMAANYAGIGLARSSMGEPDSATASYLEALKIFKEEKDAYNQAIILGNIATQFIEQNMHHKAEPYLRNALHFNNSLGNHFSLAENYNSLGTVLADRHQYDSAFFLYDESIRISRQSNYAFGEIIATFNLAKAKANAGKFDESNSLLQQVYTFCNTNNITEGMVRSLLQQGKNAIALNTPQKAQLFLKEALTLTDSKTMTSLHIEILYGLSKLAIQASPESAVFFDEYRQLTDSMAEGQRKEKMLDLEAFYHNREKENQIAQLKKDNAIQKSRKLIWILIFTVTALFAIGMVYVFRKHQVYLQTEKELAITKLNAQKLQLEKNEKEMELHRQRAEKNILARQLKEQEIMHQAISYSKLINAFHEIRERLDDFKPRLKNKRDGEAFDMVLQQIDRANGRSPLNEVITAYSELHPSFYPKLSVAFPELSPRELQICALISLNMSTKEIASLLSISIKSTEIARHRIRKKLRLDTGQNLTTEILAFV